MIANLNDHSVGTRRTARALSGFLGVGVALACTLQVFAEKPPPKKKGKDAPAAVTREKVKLIGAEGEIAKDVPEGPRPIIKAENPVHDFKTVWVGPDLRHTFTIKNEGQETLKIEAVRPACGCTVAGKYPMTIAPGESGEFPFATASTRLRGKFEKGITISSNDPVTPDLQLKIRGEVKHYVDVVPKNVYFGKIGKPEAQTRVVKITNNADKPLELELGKLPKGNIDAKLVTKEPGQAFELHVTAEPPFNTGILFKRISLKTNIEAQKTVDVEVRGNIPLRLELDPPVLNVSRRSAAGDSRGTTRTIKFTNHGDTPVKLLDATIDDPGIALQIVEQSEGKKYSVAAHFPPGYDLPSTGRTITLKTDDEAKPTINVPVKLLQRRERKAERKPRLRPAEMMAGMPAPAFNATTTEGKSLSTADLPGKVTVLDFFAVNCGFCKKQIPRLETIRKEYESKGVRFAAVSQTMRNKKATDEEVMAKIREFGFGGEVVTDPDNSVGPLFKATSFPTMVVIGKTGKIEAVNVGNIGDLETRLRGQLDAILAGRPVPRPEAVAERPQPERPKRRRGDELVGKAAPAFSIETVQGKTVSSDEFGKNSATVLNFVATNCGYCKKQVPRLEKIRQTYTEKGVRFVNVVQSMRKKFSTEEVVAKFAETGAKLEIAHDPENTVGRLYNARGFPTMVVVGKSGKVEAVNVGNLGDLEKRLTGQLDALIAGKPVPKFADARPRRRSADELIGKPAPTFAIDTLEGKKVSNDEFAKSAVTVLDFVAPNCGYCKKQLPRVEKIRETYADKGVRFVSVVGTMRKKYTTDEVVTTMDELGAKLEIAHDPENKIGQMFNASGFPTMVVVGKSGKVEAVNVGNLGDLEKRLTGQLDALIAGKPVPKFASAQRRQPRRRPAEDLLGKPAPKFSLTTLDGKVVSSDEFKNHPATVLNFIAPNCGFCKRQIPNVEKVRQEYEAKGVRFVNVAQKMRKDFTEAEIVDVLKGIGSGLEVTTGDFAENSVGRQFQAVSYPTMFVVGKDGKIANVNIGAKHNLETLLKGQLDALLKGTP